jgi:sacsin
MDICLLFLSSLQSVEFWVIREGETTPSRIAMSSITPIVDASPGNITPSRRVETMLYSNPSQGKDWLIRWHSVPNSESQDQLSTRINCDVRSTMRTEKLTATVALAIQTGVSSGGYCAPGRLFTYLPLPSGTNYPCNIHAPFALTIDRQTLRNEKEEGLVKGSDDQYVFSARTISSADCIAASALSGIGTCLIL